MKFYKLPMNIQYFADPKDGSDGKTDPKDGSEHKDSNTLDKLTKIIEGLGTKFDGLQNQFDGLKKKEPVKPPKDDKNKQDPKQGETVSIEEFNQLKQQLADMNSKNTKDELNTYARDKAKEAGLTLNNDDFDLIKGDSKESIDAKIKSFADYQERLAKKYGNPDIPINYGSKSKNKSSLQLHSEDGKLRSLEKYQTNR